MQISHLKWKKSTSSVIIRSRSLLVWRKKEHFDISFVLQMIPFENLLFINSLFNHEHFLHMNLISLFCFFLSMWTLIQISLQPTHLGTSIMKSPSGHLTNLLEPISRSSLSSSSYSVRSLTRSSSFNDLNDMKSNKPTRSSQSIRTTKILILVSTCFLILNAPAHFFIIATKLYTNIDTPVILEPLVFLSSNNRTIDPMVTDLYSSQSNTTQLLSWIHSQAIDDGIGIHLLYITILITQYISYASYSINFFLYSLSGLSFRTNLKQWTRKLVKNRAETSVM